MKDLVLVKLGGSLITDKLKPYTVRQDVLNRLVREIKESECTKLIVGHGSGSFGHQSAHKYHTQRGMINPRSCEGISVVHNDAAKLNSIVVQSFLDVGLNAISIQPSAGIICKKGKIIKWDMDPIRQMLDKNILPVPYGDVGMDISQGCCITSTEDELAYIATKLGAKRIIIVGKVDGVMTSDPVIDANAKLIREITTKNYAKIKSSLTGSDGVDVTGGMLSKVESLIYLAKKGIESEIINGVNPGNLLISLRGESGIGTLIRK